MNEIIKVYSDEKKSNVVATLDTYNDYITMGDGDYSHVYRYSDNCIGYMTKNCVYAKKTTEYEIKKDHYIGYFKSNPQLFESVYDIYTRGGRVIAKFNPDNGVIRGVGTNNNIYGYIDPNRIAYDKMDKVYAATMYVLLIIVPMYNIDYISESFGAGDSDRPKYGSTSRSSKGNSSQSDSGSDTLSTIIFAVLLLAVCIILKATGAYNNPYSYGTATYAATVTATPTPYPSPKQTIICGEGNKGCTLKGEYHADISPKPTLGTAEDYKDMVFEGAIRESYYLRHCFDDYAETFGFNIIRDTNANLNLVVKSDKKVSLRVYIYDSENIAVVEREHINSKSELRLPAGNPGDQYKVVVACEKGKQGDTTTFKVETVNTVDPEVSQEDYAKYMFNLDVKRNREIRIGVVCNNYCFQYTGETISFHVDNTENKHVQLKVSPGLNVVNVYVFDEDGNLITCEEELTEQRLYYDLPVRDQYIIKITGVKVYSIIYENTIEVLEIKE